MAKSIRWLLLLAALAYLTLALALYFNQRNLLFHPSEKIDIPGDTEFFIDSGEHRIRIHQINPGQPHGVIYFGGNAEAVGRNAGHHIEQLPNHTLYLVNYRGYGGSSGAPSQRALFEDALAIWDQLRDRHRQLSVLGRSLGSGVACYLASQRPVARLALITPYDSIRSVAQSHYPMFPMALLVTDPFDSLSRVDRIRAQTLVVIGGRDTVIPPRHAEALAAAFPADQITIARFPAGDHYSVSDSSKYTALLRNFFDTASASD